MMIFFDEIECFNTILGSLESDEKTSDCLTKYQKILSSNNFPNLLKVIETVFSIPIGNDFVERVFSHMHDICSDKRNRINVHLIKAEICIKNNFRYSCIEFKQFIQNQQNVLKLAKSTEKYDF